MSSNRPPPVAFGPFRLDQHGRRLTRAGVEISLGGRAFDVLCVLADTGGEAVSKDTLLDRVWPGLMVEENNLQVQISTLRKVLGESRIATIPGRGYRLTDPVLAGSDTADLILPDRPSIAVLPFRNLSNDADQEYFAEGMVEEIITALSRVHSFFVIASSSSFAYKGKLADVRQVGRELGVRYVLEGSVRKAEHRVRIAGQLVDATTGAHLWADRFDETLDNIFDLQDQVTASVVAAIEPKLRVAEIERAQRKPTENLHAYDLFLRAAGYFQRTRLSMRDSEAAIQLLSEAVKLDPNFAIAHALMAEYYWATAAQLRREPPDPWALEAVRVARLALSLGGDDPEVLWRVAAAIAAPGGRLDEALALVEKSLALNPNSVGAHYQHARLLSYRGDTDAALAELERAARLSPIDIRPFRIEFDYTLTHFIAGRYDAALEWSERTLRSMPGYTAALRYKAASLGLLDRIEEAHQTVQELLAANPELTVTRARAHIKVGMNNVFRTPGFADAMCRGLRLAGLPE